jgi:hypothetical protein
VRTPYRSARQLPPEPPSVALWLECVHIGAAMVLAVFAVVVADRTSVVWPMVVPFVLLLFLGRDIGRASGRREQHQAWLQIFGPDDASPASPVDDGIEVRIGPLVARLETQEQVEEYLAAASAAFSDLLKEKAAPRS